MQSCKDVPDTWIFEHYCNTGEALTGQDIKITSVFNTKERTPSMCIFYSQEKSRYMFKDFSTGKGGSAIRLVQDLFNESFHEASQRILGDYNRFILLNNGTHHKITEFKVRSKYKVTEQQVRSWNTRDKYFWQQFHIGSKLLEYYQIRPLQSYKMTKEEDGETKSLTIEGPFLYGYFKKDGTLYKIYQPMVKTHKFIKVRDYMQGSEQLEGSPLLIIASSLKDSMVIKSLGVQADFLVPDSENTTIKPEKIKELQQQYSRILTLFDNDDAGIAAMQKYKELYGIQYVYFHIEKDVADAVKAHGPDKIRTVLVPLINKKIN